MKTLELLSKLEKAGCLVEKRIPGNHMVQDNRGRHLFTVREYPDRDDIIDLHGVRNNGDTKLRAVIRVKDINVVRVEEAYARPRRVCLDYGGDSPAAFEFTVTNPIDVIHLPRKTSTVIE